MSKQHPHKHSKKKPQAVNAAACPQRVIEKDTIHKANANMNHSQNKAKKALLLRQMKMRERKQKHPVISKTNKIFSDRQRELKTKQNIQTQNENKQKINTVERRKSNNASKT